MKIKRAGIVRGIDGDICFLDVDLTGTAEPSWTCSNSQGYSDGVSPDICPPLRRPIPANFSEVCYWPLPLGVMRERDNVERGLERE